MIDANEKPIFHVVCSDLLSKALYKGKGEEPVKVCNQNLFWLHFSDTAFKQNVSFPSLRHQFAYLENKIRSEGALLQETPLDRMEELWQEAKRDESATAITDYKEQ